MAKNKKMLNPAAGLFSQAQGAQEVQEILKNAHDAQDVQYEQQVQVAHEAQQASGTYAIDSSVTLVKMTLNNTQGRKGYKLPRINMAFTPENHEFVKYTSRRQGISATEYVNRLIDEARRNM